MNIDGTQQNIRAVTVPDRTANLLDARLKVLPLKPRLVRRLGIAHRDEASLDGSTERVIETLVRFRQG